MTLCTEDARIQKHVFRPGINSDREHGPIYSQTTREVTYFESMKFRETVAAQLRDLFATI